MQKEERVKLAKIEYDNARWALKNPIACALEEYLPLNLIKICIAYYPENFCLVCNNFYPVSICSCQYLPQIPKLNVYQTIDVIKSAHTHEVRRKYGKRVDSCHVATNENDKRVIEYWNKTVNLSYSGRCSNDPSNLSIYSFKDIFIYNGELYFRLMEPKNIDLPPGSTLYFNNVSITVFITMNGPIPPEYDCILDSETCSIHKLFI